MSKKESQGLLPGSPTYRVSRLEITDEQIAAIVKTSAKEDKKARAAKRLVITNAPLPTNLSDWTITKLYAHLCSLLPGATQHDPKAVCGSQQESKTPRPTIRAIYCRWLDIGHRPWGFNRATHRTELEVPTLRKLFAKILHRLISNADYTLTFNGQAFDDKVAATAFLRHSLPAVPPTRSLDVLKILRRHFKLNVVAGSNKLQDVAQFLLGEGKVEHSGADLWFKVMQGNDDEAHQTMLDYCKKDTWLTVKLWMKTRAFFYAHPSFNHITRKLDCCPVCQSPHIHKKGYRFTKTTIVQRFQCQNCSHYFSGQPTKTKVVI